MYAFNAWPTLSSAGSLVSAGVLSREGNDPVYRDMNNLLLKWVASQEATS